MRRVQWVVAGLVVGCLLSGEVRAQALSIGEAFQVNSYTTDNQGRAAVAVEPGGNFVVVWQSIGSAGSDGSYYSVQGQRFASGGAALGDEFQVNTYTTGFQVDPAVAGRPDGNLVVVWESFAQGGVGPESIQGQRYSSDGSPIGSEFQVNTYTSSYRRSADVAMSSTGAFVVVWASDGSASSDTSAFSVQGQRYASDGSALGGEFQVNTFTTSYQVGPSVAVDPSGAFVVVWESLGSGGTDQSETSIQGQRYASDGSALGGEFQVNTDTTFEQARTTVAADSDGNFIVVWQSRRPGDPEEDVEGGGGPIETSIQGQRYSSDGSALGGEFQVNTHTTFYQGGAQVAASSGGDFVVVWNTYVDDRRGGYAGPAEVLGKVYASDGSATGAQFQINSYTTGVQKNPAVALDAAGNFVVAWRSYGSAGSDPEDASVQGQRYAIALFADGFESGDTLAW